MLSVRDTPFLTHKPKIVFKSQNSYVISDVKTGEVTAEGTAAELVESSGLVF